MSGDFDPYLKWLGIRDSKQTPNHYRLLGIDLYEADLEVISGAADRQMSHVRSFQSGPNAAASQKLLNELATARRCLLDSDTRIDYEHELREQLSTQADHRQNNPVEESIAIGARSLADLNAPVHKPKIFDEPPGQSSDSLIDLKPVPTVRTRSAKKKSILPSIVGTIGGGLAAVVVAYFLLPYVLPENPLAKPPEDLSLNQTESVQKPKPRSQRRKPKTQRKRPKPSDVASVNKRPKKKPAAKPVDPGEKKKPPANSLLTTPTKKPLLLKANPAESSLAPWLRESRMVAPPPALMNSRAARPSDTSSSEIAISQREYQLALEFWSEAKSQSRLSTLDVDLSRTIAQLQWFWSVVRNSLASVHPSDTLEFAGVPVTVKSVSGDIIELQYKDTVKSFFTDIRYMDRDLAVALASRDASTNPLLCQMLLERDFLHSKLRLPYTFPRTAERSAMTQIGDYSRNVKAMEQAETLSRFASPEKVKVKTARDEILKFRESDLSQKNLAQCREIARGLILNASAESDPVKLCALLDASIYVSTLIGDGATALEALLAMERRVDIKFWALADKMLDSLSETTVSGMQTDGLVYTYFKLVQLAAERRDFSMARKFASQGASWASKKRASEYFDKSQSRILQRYVKQLKEMETLTKQKSSLDGPPKSAVNCDILGRYLCFVERDWKRGLPYLTKSNDFALATLATEEQSLDFSNRTNRIALADRWLKAAEKTRSDLAKRCLKSRALRWYQSASIDMKASDAKEIDLKISQLAPNFDYFKHYRDNFHLVRTAHWKFIAETEQDLSRISIDPRLSALVLYSTNDSQRLNFSKHGETYDTPSAQRKMGIYRMRLLGGRILEVKRFNSTSGRLERIAIGKTDSH